MLFASNTADSVVVVLVILTENPVEFMIEHQGDKVNMREQESSSGFWDERW